MPLQARVLDTWSLALFVEPLGSRVSQEEEVGHSERALSAGPHFLHALHFPSHLIGGAESQLYTRHLWPCLSSLVKDRNPSNSELH